MKKVKRAFYSMNMWHIWNAFEDDSRGGYETAKTKGELFKQMYKRKYSFIGSANTDYYFEKED